MAEPTSRNWIGLVGPGLLVFGTSLLILGAPQFRLAFAALHQQWVGGFVAGVLYAYAQKRRGLVSDAILAHAVTNALIAVEVLAVGHWSLW